MTPQQKMLVQCSFAVVKPMGERGAALFFDRLFQLDPALRPIISEELRGELMEMIGVAVGGLDRMDQILRLVEDLGRRYAAYGIRDEHYRTVAEALLWTLEKGLGENFTPPVKEACGVVYFKIATAMQRGAANAYMFEAVGA
jgi:hemoglobin-like flavoprotein